MSKTKKEKEVLLLKTFSVHETDRKVVRHLKRAILSHKHLENMLNILLKKELDKIYLVPEKENRDFTMFNLLTNSVIMKAVLGNTAGKEATAETIALVNNYFGADEIFISAKQMVENINAHNMSMIVRRLCKDWDNARENRALYFADRSAFTGEPRYPQQKKLSKVYQYSVPVEKAKYSLKRKNVLGINLFRKMIYTRFPTNDYIKDKIIQSMTVSLSHGNIYYNFSYVVPESEKQTVNTTKNTKKKLGKEAGLDIGVKNLFALFVNDKTTQSMIFNGSQFIKYNCFYNKQLAKLNTEISKEVVSNREVKTQNGDNIKIPTAYNMAGRHLIKKRSQLHECRNRYFESEMHKISKKLLTHLKHNGVTDLYLSTNLSFTKESGKIKMRKASKQQFYQIPFGRLLNNIKAKAAMFDINYHDVDEAYTSKTSCLTRDVLLNQMKKPNKEVVTLDDLNGSRGVKGSELGRGMYKDTELNIVFNSDLNGAANHIKVGCNEIDLSIYRNHLWKLANPVKIKSTNEFDVLLKNVK